jgi:glycosyltransferase involved in cell wall biosynthesis
MRGVSASPEAFVPTLSALVMTQNMAETTRRCLESVKWADEIVVVDSFSTDGTLDVCGEYGARVFERQYDRAAHQVLFGLEHVTSDWTLRIDADEEATADLAREIGGVTAEDGDGYDGFEVPRLILFDGRPLRHGGAVTAPLRLARTRLFDHSTERVHARGIVHGKVRRLKHHLLHYSYADYADLLARMNRYSDLVQSHLAPAKGVVRPPYLLLRLLYEFGYRYLMRGGFLDGVPGLMWCVSHTTYTFAKYAKLWERNRGLRADDDAAT